MTISKETKNLGIAGSPGLIKVIFAALCVICLGSIAARAQDAGVRLTPPEINALPTVEAGTGTSGVAGIRTRVLKGDPNKAGLYTIRLFVPANTRIEAHTHPDDRAATVISGTWYIGYGSSFDEKKLEALPPGSFYTEPPGEAHFARTGNVAVIVQITGYGPSGTEYVGPKEKH